LRAARFGPEQVRRRGGRAPVARVPSDRDANPEPDDRGPDGGRGPPVRDRRQGHSVRFPGNGYDLAACWSRPDELRYLLRLAEALKLAKYAGTETRQLASREIALIFAKTSTRTRSAFEVCRLRPGRARDLPRPVRIPARAQGVDRRHRRGPGPHVRRDRIPRQQPGRRRRTRRPRRRAGLQRADGRMAPHPDARRLPDHARGQPQALRRPHLHLCGRLPLQHGPFPAGDRRAPGSDVRLADPADLHSPMDVADLAKDIVGAPVPASRLPKIPRRR
jgi:Aspartate/ornithine carbamoyltransferase, carbamoyl-P binding domain